MDMSYITSNQKSVYSTLESAEDSQNSSLDLIPNEILSSILSYFNTQGPSTFRNIKAVSHRFNNVGREILDPSFKDNEWLIQASKAGNDIVGKMLLNDKRVDTSARNNEAIIQACKKGHIKMMQLLLDENKAICKIDANDATFVEIYLGDRVDPSVRENEATICVIEAGNVKAATILIQDTRVSLDVAMIHAIKNDQPEILEIILANERSNSVIIVMNWIYEACKQGSVNVLKVMLKDKRFTPSSQNNGSLFIACSFGYLEIVRELLKDDRVNPASRKNAAIRQASLFGHLEIVKELMKDIRTNPSAENNEAIQSAIRNNHTEIVEELKKDQRVLDLANF